VKNDDEDDNDDNEKDSNVTPTI